jgi:hypothetical protein
MIVVERLLWLLRWWWRRDVAVVERLLRWWRREYVKVVGRLLWRREDVN